MARCFPNGTMTLTGWTQDKLREFLDFAAGKGVTQLAIWTDGAMSQQPPGGALLLMTASEWHCHLRHGCVCVCSRWWQPRVDDVFVVCARAAALGGSGARVMRSEG